MSLKEKPFWMDTVAMPEPEAARPWPGKADVAVIGSGFTGLSAARALAERHSLENAIAAHAQFYQSMLV